MILLKGGEEYEENRIRLDCIGAGNHWRSELGTCRSL